MQQEIAKISEQREQSLATLSVRTFGRNAPQVDENGVPILAFASGVVVKDKET